MEKPNRVLITGHRGFIGSHLVKYLENDYNIIGYDLVEGNNILDMRKLAGTKCDAVIHLAAKCNVNESWLTPKDYFETNIEGTQNVLSLGKRVILASSCTADTPKTSPYGLSKLACEMINPYISLRLANVYGPGQSPTQNRAIDSFVRGAKAGEVTVYGKGTSVRDYIHVSDVCRAFKMALESNLEGIFGIGTGVATTVNQLKDMIIEKYNPNCVTKYAPELKEAESGLVEVGSAKKLLGFEAKIPLEVGLNEDYL